MIRTRRYRWEPNIRLKLAIVADGRKVTDIARCAGLSQVTVSGAVTGRCRATPNVRRRLAFALGVPESELFENDTAEVMA